MLSQNSYIFQIISTIYLTSLDFFDHTGNDTSSKYCILEDI